jgi:hypothetical protein
LTFVIIDIEWEGIVEFTYELGSKKTHHHLPFNLNVEQYSAPNSLIANIQTNETITINFHTMQMTQAMSLLKVQTKIILDIGCDQLEPNMTIVFFVHALHL